MSQTKSECLTCVKVRMMTKAKDRKSHLLCVNAVALEESLRVGVGEAVAVPQGAGCLQELCLSCALLTGKEPWGKKRQMMFRSGCNEHGPIVSKFNQQYLMCG